MSAELRWETSTAGVAIGKLCQLSWYCRVQRVIITHWCRWVELILLFTDWKHLALTSETLVQLISFTFTLNATYSRSFSPTVTTLWKSAKDLVLSTISKRWRNRSRNGSSGHDRGYSCRWTTAHLFTENSSVWFMLTIPFLILFDSDKMNAFMPIMFLPCVSFAKFNNRYNYECSSAHHVVV